MVAGEIELAANIGMALETDCVGRPGWVYRLSRANPGRSGPSGAEAKWSFRLSTRLRMKAARAMARFATGVQRVFP